MQTIRFGTWQDGSWYSPPEGTPQRIIAVTLVCDDERKTIWREDDAMQVCSRQMDAYYTLRDAYSALSTLENPTPEQAAQMDQYVSEMRALRDQAPEWQ